MARIAATGTYLVLNKDYQEVERQVKNFLDRCRRTIGKRLIVSNGKVVTAYHPAKKYRRRLLRRISDSDLKSRAEPKNGFHP